MSLRRRTYPEVVENLLTAITRGVSAEPHPFPPPGGGAGFRHQLERPPVASVVSVFGSRGGRSHRFRPESDFRLEDDALVWQEGAELPDPGTMLHVNYVPRDAGPVVTDLQAGSVVRTLAEAVALEVARLYAELDAVYRAGFVDTAEGRSLDNLVALLGIERIAGGRAAGEVELRRAEDSRGAVFVPTGTRVITADGEVEYETTADVTLNDGQRSVRVPARDLEPGNPPLGAGALSVLPVPIAGIVAVTNPAPTAVGARDESDVELRARAKSFLAGSERATRGSLQHALARQGVRAEIEELASDGVLVGRVRVTPREASLSPEQEQRLIGAIESVRPLGVDVRLAGVDPPQAIDLELRLTSAPGLLEDDLRGAQQQVREAIEAFFAALPAREAASLNRLVGAVLAVPGMVDVQVVSATLGDGRDVLDRAAGALAVAGISTRLGALRLADPALPTRLDAVVAFPADAAPPDAAALAAALGAAVSYLNEVNAGELPASDPRRAVSYRRLLHVVPLPGRPAGTLRAIDEEIAAGGAPPLPAAADVAPYVVRFALSSASGVARLLTADADEAPLTPFERWTLGGVELQPEEA